MKKLQLTREQQVQFAQRVNEELEKMTMSWTNELRQWHPMAIKALDYANLKTLQIPSTKYGELFEVETHGINMNIVAALANNLEIRTPAEMNMTALQFCDVIRLNDEIGNSWNKMVEPIRKKVEKEFEIMNNKPKLVIAE